MALTGRDRCSAALRRRSRTSAMGTLPPFTFQIRAAATSLKLPSTQKRPGTSRSFCGAGAILGHRGPRDDRAGVNRSSCAAGRTRTFPLLGGARPPESGARSRTVHIRPRRLPKHEFIDQQKPHALLLKAEATAIGVGCPVCEFKLQGCPAPSGTWGSSAYPHCRRGI
jgi:hypothetical protein